MHFHLPKPLRGWREFAGEVGVIVLGVLIALGAQQLAEARQWKNDANAARQALAGELAGHYTQAVEWRTIEPCVAAQLDRLEARLLASGDRNRPAPLFSQNGRRFVLRAPSRPYPDSVWQGVLAQGTSTHLTDQERLDLGSEYNQAANVDELNNQMIETITRLYSLSRPIALDATARLSLLQSVDEVRDTNYWTALIGGQIVATIHDLHLAPPAGKVRDIVAQSGTVAFCRSQKLPLRPFAEAIKPLD